MVVEELKANTGINNIVSTVEASSRQSSGLRRLEKASLMSSIPVAQPKVCQMEWIALKRVERVTCLEISMRNFHCRRKAHWANIRPSVNLPQCVYIYWGSRMRILWCAPFLGPLYTWQEGSREEADFLLIVSFSSPWMKLLKFEVLN